MHTTNFIHYHHHHQKDDVNERWMTTIWELKGTNKQTQLAGIRREEATELKYIMLNFMPYNHQK